MTSFYDVIANKFNHMRSLSEDDNDYDAQTDPIHSVEIDDHIMPTTYRPDTP